MNRQDFPQQLLSIISERAVQEHDLPEDNPRALTQFLVDECGLTKTEANAVVGAEGVILEEPALRSLAQMFVMSPELLGCLMRPVSTEVLQHTLVEVVTDLNDVCDYCSDLIMRVQESSSSDPYGQLLQLCADAISHVIFPSEDDFFDERAANEAIEAMMPSTVAEVLMQLDQAARLRVLAYALQELSQTTDGREASVFAACARLRGEISPLARTALDLLSQAPEGEAVFSDLAQSLPNGASPEVIERALSMGVASLSEVGLALSENPLTVLPGPPVRLRLSNPACLAWRALMHAEQLQTAS